MIDGVNTTAGWNRYMYVRGNPIMYKDPTGHFICGGICIAVVATVAAVGAYAVDRIFF